MKGLKRASTVPALLLLSAITVTGCVSVSQEAANVQVHAQVSNLLDDCKKLGPVTAEASDIDGITTSAFTVAEARLRQAAHDQYGADSVAVVNSDKTSFGVRLQGIAFDCYN